MPRELSGLMEELAVSLAKEAGGNIAPDRERVDTFKVLTTYYLGTEKLDKSPDDAANSGFGGIRTRLEAVK